MCETCDATGSVEGMRAALAGHDVNVPMLRKVMDHIDAYPDEHEQGSWVWDYNRMPPELLQTVAFKAPACGTAMCFAGHAVHMAGGEMIFANPGAFQTVTCKLDGLVDTIENTATEVLGLPYGVAQYLFESARTQDELRDAVRLIEHAVSEREIV